MPQLHELWPLRILHAWSSHPFICRVHPQGLEMALLCEAGNLSNQPDFTLHPSCPPFHLLILPDTAGWKKTLDAGSKQRENLLGALRQHKGFYPEGCVFPLGNRGMGTLDLSLIFVL